MDSAQENDSAPPLWFGLLFAGAGAYFILACFGIVPLPGGTEAVNGPLILLFGAGLVFLLGGITVLIQWAGGAPQRTGELPPDAPKWMHVTQYLAVLVVVGILGAIGSWIALGTDGSGITMSAPFLGGGPGGMIGRIAFGLGSVIVWVYFFALAGRLLRVLRAADKN
jgi:hypothetical protein